MVLVLHALMKTGALEYGDSLLTYAYYWLLEAACICAVNIFVLISGYFQINAQFKGRNVIKIAFGGVWIYSVMFSWVEIVFEGYPLTLRWLIKAFFPLLTKKYWFANAYLVLYIISPFLDKLLLSLSAKQRTIFVAILIALFSIRTTIFPLSWGQDLSGGMGILWFVTLYCVAAWLRLYFKERQKPLKYWLVYLAATALLAGSKIILMVLGAEEYSGKLYGYSSCVVLIQAVALFMAFLNSRLIVGKWAQAINAIAKHSFSVYIIHFTMWNVLFTTVLHVDYFVHNIFSGTAAILIAVMLIFVFCVIVDCAKEFCEKRLIYSFNQIKAGRLFYSAIKNGMT